jgi:phosphatidylserine decarboxylase
MASEKVLIGVFMSPFDVHYNRAPLTGVVESIRDYPPRRRNVHMAHMHLRTHLKMMPFYRNSLHVIQNERKVTKITGDYKGEPLSCYVIQIAGKRVNGIDSFVAEGDTVNRSTLIGMIKIGSQVDLLVPYRAGMEMKVRPGDKVRAGETVLID